MRKWQETLVESGVIDQDNREDASSLPAPLSSRINRDGDEWFEYDGDPMFSEEVIELLENRFRQMEEYDWEKVQSSRRKIRTGDVDEFEEAIKKQFEDVHEEFNFLVDQSLPDVTEKGPQKSVASVYYNKGHSVAMGGERWKRQRIILEIREFEQWYFHENVVKPVMDKYNEKYSY